MTKSEPLGNPEQLDDERVRKVLTGLHEDYKRSFDGLVKWEATGSISGAARIDLRAYRLFAGMAVKLEKAEAENIDLKFKLAGAELRVYGKNNKLKQRIAELENQIDTLIDKEVVRNNKDLAG